jgi:hypothetical protein
MQLNRAMAYLQGALADVVGHGSEVRGSIDGKLFIIRDNFDTLHVMIGTTLPTSVAITRGRGTLGDPTFDAAFEVTADLPSRAMLDAAMRAKLHALFGTLAFELHNGWFDIVIDDEAADGPAIERLVRDGIALGSELASHAQLTLEAFIDAVPREPIPAVRANHYRWLVAHGREVPAVLHLAARDSDPEIRQWAQRQRPVETLYR